MKPIVTFENAAGKDDQLNMDYIGIIHQYRGAEPRHILDLMRLMDEELYDSENLTAFIQKHYSRFFQIDKTMNSPPVLNKKDLLEPNWLEIILPGFNPESMSSNCDIEYSRNQGNIVRMKPVSNNPFPFSKIFFNTENEEAYFSSMTLRGYRELCSIMSDYILPENPDFCFSMTMYTVMEQDMDLPLPGKRWELFFSDTENETSPAEQALLDTYNTLLKEALDAENRGLKFDLFKRGKELGLEEENIRSVGELLERLRQK